MAEDCAYLCLQCCLGIGGFGKFGESRGAGFVQSTILGCVTVILVIYCSNELGRRLAICWYLQCIKPWLCEI